MIREFSLLAAFYGAHCVLHFPGSGEEEAGNDSAGARELHRERGDAGSLPGSEAGAEKAPEAAQALIRTQGIKSIPLQGDGESAREGKVYLEKQPWAACPHQAFS